MDISGSYTLYAPRERVWYALLDPDALRTTVPGIESLEREGADIYKVRVNIGVAAVKGVYDGTLHITDQHPPDAYGMVVNGKGARGVLHGEGTLTLTSPEPGATVVTYSGQAQLGGPIAGVGMRVASGAANMLIKAYFSRLADTLAEQGDAVRATTTAAAPSYRSESASAPVATATQVAPTMTAAPLQSPPYPASAIPAVPRRGPLVQFVRRAGLTDGSVESERLWARRAIGGLFVAGAAIAALLAYLTARATSH
jgi:carbon monoxide dehydrogenase subunit G